MKHLWSPWRRQYIESHDKQEGCIFCTALARPDGPENLIIVRGRHAFAILNKFPYTSGHMMIAPFEHRPSLEELEPAARAEMMELLSGFIVTLREVYQPQAFNLGANIGAAAGAGVPGHVHMHIVPRWAGDTNFMTSVGGTRVLPESLEDTYARLLAAWTRTHQG